MDKGRDQYDYMFKMILLGSIAVGKSNILLRFTRDKFNQSSQSTYGVQFATKTVQANGKIIKLQIWDTCSQQQYKSIMKTYYKGASAVMLIYDITNEKSYNDLDYWYNQIKQYSKNQIVIMLVGNKSDLEEARKISKQKGFQYAENKKIAFYQVSAKDGTNINLIFTKIAQQLQKLMSEAQKVKKSTVQTYQQPKPIEKNNKPQPSITLQRKSFVDKEKQKIGCCKK